jgi:hypothetical protein
VERRQASAPAAEGRRKPALRGAPRTRWCGHETLRLSAFRFLLFLLFVLPFLSSSFVIAGLDPAIHAEATPRRTSRVANRTSAWTTGSSPVVTKRMRYRQITPLENASLFDN